MNDNNFFVIPSFEKYSINKEGSVKCNETGKILKGWINNYGYVYYHLYSSVRRNKTTVARHTLIAKTFLPANTDPAKIYVNHINGIKGDDRIENLEWVTPQENVEHAGRIGLTAKCLPVETMDEEGKIKEYPSALKCGMDNGVTKDAILWRLKSKGSRIFEDGKRYRVKSNLPWSTEIDYTGIEIRHIDEDNKIVSFKKLIDAAEYLKISPSTLSTWINRKYDVNPGNIQIRINNDPWPEIDKVKLYENDIIVLDSEVSTIYKGLTETAKILNMGKTTLHYRLNQRTLKPFKDGKSYLWFNDYLKYKNSPCNQ